MHRKKEVVQKENKVKVNLTRKIEKPSLDMHFVHHQSPQKTFGSKSMQFIHHQSPQKTFGSTSNFRRAANTINLKDGHLYHI